MKKAVFAFAALFILGIASLGVVSAYKGDPAVQGPNYNEERHEAMTAAFANNDYEAWYELMSEDERHPHVLDVINEENFGTFVALHEAKVDGDFEQVEVLSEELGLQKRQGNPRGNAMRNENNHRFENCKQWQGENVA